jgi:hypothetical protein
VLRVSEDVVEKEYWVLIDQVDALVDETSQPHDTRNTAQVLGGESVVVAGHIETMEERDVYALTVSPFGWLRAQTHDRLGTTEGRASLVSNSSVATARTGECRATPARAAFGWFCWA